MKIVLLVDDDESKRSVIRYGLENNLNEEYKIEEAEDGDSALDLYLKYKEHIIGVITDCNMPKGNGVNLCRNLRELGYIGPIDMVTADPRNAKIKEVEKYNVNIYPFINFTESLPEIIAHLTDYSSNKLLTPQESSQVS